MTACFAVVHDRRGSKLMSLSSRELLVGVGDVARRSQKQVAVASLDFAESLGAPFCAPAVLDDHISAVCFMQVDCVVDRRNWDGLAGFILAA